MKAAHPRSATDPAPMPRARLRTIAMPVSAIALGAAATMLGLGHDGAVDPDAFVARSATTASTTRAVTFHPAQRGTRGPDVAAPARRWPDEIEQLLATMPRLGDDPHNLPTIETDQRCSRMEDGLAHCVVLECQTAGDQTACFEMVVTARRLHAPPHAMEERDDEDAADGGEPFTAPSLLDARHPFPRAAGGVRPVAGL